MEKLTIATEATLAEMEKRKQESLDRAYKAEEENHMLNGTQSLSKNQSHGRSHATRPGLTPGENGDPGTSSLQPTHHAEEENYINYQQTHHHQTGEVSNERVLVTGGDDDPFSLSLIHI